MPEGESLPTGGDVVVPTTPSLKEDVLCDALQQHTDTSGSDVRSILTTNVADNGVSRATDRA